MHTCDEELSLSTMMEGAAIERFDVALYEILENIKDLNTDAEAVREITLKVKIKPDKERNFITFGMQVMSKPAPLSAIFSKAFVEKDAIGKIECREIEGPRQMELPTNVTKINERKAND